MTRPIPIRLTEEQLAWVSWQATEASTTHAAIFRKVLDGAIAGTPMPEGPRAVAVITEDALDRAIRELSVEAERG